MDSKKINAMWSICLFAIGIATVILAGANIAGIKLPDIAVRVLGVIDLTALPFLAFSTVKKFQNRK